VVAAKAGGVSPHRLVAPVLAGALALTAVTALVNETLVLRATRLVERPERGDAPEIVFRAGSFWYHRGRTIYNIRRADASASTLHGVSVYERDAADRLVRSVHARTATIEGPDAWRFQQATIRHFDPERPDATPRFERRDEIVLTVSEDPELGVLEADPAVLSLANLRRYIDARREEGEDVTPFRAMLHARLAAPFTVFLFALLAVPAALQAERTRTLATPALQGIALLVVYWFVYGLGQMLSSRGIPHTEWAPFVVLAAFLAAGSARLARVPA
jgi:lipopolysaccharide export LptBFGC system permease protein LptF